MTRQTQETRAKKRRQKSASPSEPAIPPPPPTPRELRASKSSKPAPGKGGKGTARKDAGKVERAKGAKAKKIEAANGRGDELDFEALVAARPTRAERSVAEERGRRVDEVCAAWAAIVAERMAADQAFAELYEHFRGRSGDLRSLFAWDALHHAEAHLALVNNTIARHLSDDGRADPRVILADLRWERRKVAAVYAINAFVAVLNQMGPTKAKWLEMQEFDPKIAVLALAHQTLHYALESIRVEAPADLTESILRAAQDESAWAVQHRSDVTRLASAAAASAVFFRLVGANELVTAEEVASLYATRARKR